MLCSKLYIQSSINTGKELRRRAILAWLVSGRYGFKIFINFQAEQDKGQLISKQNCRALTSPKKRTKLIIMSMFSSQDSELGSFFGRSHGSTILFRD